MKYKRLYCSVGGGVVVLQIGRSGNSSGAFGDTVPYALSNKGLGWPPNQPLGCVWGGV